MKRQWFIIILLFLFSACSESGKVEPSPDSSFGATPFTITKESQLIGGPVAIGRVGDELLENDRIRVIIQKPTRNSDLGTFGGTIIDADIQRGSGGNDNFGELFPMINAEWTVNYQSFEALSTKGTKILRAYGKIDAYDYLDIDFVGDVAEGAIGQKLYFSNRFDDRKNPFSVYKDLNGISEDVITDYILEPGKNYIRIETTIKNEGSEDVLLPTGMFVNGSGQLNYLVPGQGFTPDIMMEVAGPSTGIIYEGFDGVDVSYGFFWDPSQFIDPETSKYFPTTSVTFSSVTIFLCYHFVVW